MQQKTQLTFPIQFAMLLSLLGIGIIVGNLFILGLGANLMHVPMKEVPALLTKPGFMRIAQLLNSLASLIVFCIPAIVLAKILNNHPFQQLQFRSKIALKQVLLVVLLAFTGLLLSGALGELNESIWLPAKWLIKAREMENSYKETMLSMATMHSFTDYLIALLVMAFCPALFEEVLFRGGFQQIFVGWTKNIFLGILITSILFSAIHFSFFGFLPRLGLGMVLGYVFYFGRNIWLNILMHFFYNGMIVTQLYVASIRGKNIEKTMDENMPIWWGLLAIFAVVYLLQALKKETTTLHNANSVELD
ncbi:MAG: CPBP family intramembrane metalloprotease [Bacteroidetes bacterium]|nr:CPBP family intramembrane metalloprotease [Bacteroidota bacterium]